jgi:AbrB family looped-hinge helix DNA binding protein
MVWSCLAMSESSASGEVSLGRQGRLVIPAPLRRSLGLKEGDRLVARQEADRLVLEKPEQIKQRLKARRFRWCDEIQLALGEVQDQVSSSAAMPRCWSRATACRSKDRKVTPPSHCP